MKRRRIKYYTSKTLLNAWRLTLERINEIKANGYEGLDPYSVAEVTDYIIANIDHYRPTAELQKVLKTAPGSAQFAAGDNRPHNQLAEGVNDAG